MEKRGAIRREGGSHVALLHDKCLRFAITAANELPRVINLSACLDHVCERISVFFFRKLFFFDMEIELV